MNYIDNKKLIEGLSKELPSLKIEELNIIAEYLNSNFQNILYKDTTINLWMYIIYEKNDLSIKDEDGIYIISNNIVFLDKSIYDTREKRLELSKKYNLRQIDFFQEQFKNILNYIITNNLNMYIKDIGLLNINEKTKKELILKNIENNNIYDILEILTEEDIDYMIINYLGYDFTVYGLNHKKTVSLDCNRHILELFLKELIQIAYCLN